MSKYSTFVRGERQKLWKTSEPFEMDGEKGIAEYIVSSVCSDACTASQGKPECYLFAANADGEILDWLEMEGSAKGTTDHRYVMGRSAFPPRDEGAAAGGAA